MLEILKRKKKIEVLKTVLLDLCLNPNLGSNALLLNVYINVISEVLKCHFHMYIKNYIYIYIYRIYTFYTSMVLNFQLCHPKSNEVLFIRYLVSWHEHQSKRNLHVLPANQTAEINRSCVWTKYF